MTTIEILKREKRIVDNSLLTFLSTLNNSIFTTRFFKTISNQIFDIAEVITVPEELFFDSTHNKNFSNLNKNTLYIGRKRNGSLIGSIFIDDQGKALISYVEHAKQVDILNETSKSLRKELNSL